MNPKQLVKLSNKIGVVAITLLVYWVFMFITIQVFGLKIFKENLTETFYLSILGILALMTGALFVNIMFNLTRIAQKHNQDEVEAFGKSRVGWVFLLTLPVLLAALFVGDFLTTRKKENMLVDSASSIIEINKQKGAHLVDYKFDEAWIIRTKEILEVLSKTDKNFPFVSILVKDSIEGEPAILGFTNRYHGTVHDTIVPIKANFIRQTTSEEREYLKSVFDENSTDHRYSSYKGRYELFYPYTDGDKKVVIYFSEQQRYGKIGR